MPSAKKSSQLDHPAASLERTISFHWQRGNEEEE